MGYYGNTLGVPHSPFAFDKVYSNRKSMDEMAASDNVYIGRYVLVDYGNDYIPRRAYVAADDADAEDTQLIKLYYSSDCADATVIKSVQEDMDVYTYSVKIEDVINCEVNSKHVFYQCVEIDSVTKICKFIKIGTYDTISEYPNQYSFNYMVDKEEYESIFDDGWDSTVWQKAMSNGEIVYKLIASLNAGAPPKIGVSADCPTQTPILPHFGANTTNRYYDLHLQPTWGFRIRSTTSDLQTPKVKASGTTLTEKVAASVNTENSDPFVFPSDAITTWDRTFYDKETGELSTKYFNPEQGVWIDQAGAEVPAAIYFNKAGFDPNTITYSNDHKYKGHPTWKNNDTDGGEVVDEIKLCPSGQSGILYTNHEDEATAAPDIQELSIMLPSIGDSIAKMWNIVYGDETLNSGRTRNTNLSWEDAGRLQQRNGLRLVTNSTNGYLLKQDNLQTLAGCINSAHDALGMIIVNGLPAIDDASTEKIYYSSANEKFYKKTLTYSFTPIDPTDSDYWEVSEDGATLVLHYDEVTDMMSWTPGAYFYKEINNYIVANEAQAHLGRNYYVIDDDDWEEITLTEAYEAQKFYYAEQALSGGTPIEGKYNYIRADEIEASNDKTYYLVESSGITRYYYTANNPSNSATDVWYYTALSESSEEIEEGSEESSETVIPTAATEASMIREGRQYWIKTKTTSQDESGTIVETVTYNPIALDMIMEFGQSEEDGFVHDFYLKDESTAKYTYIQRTPIDVSKSYTIYDLTLTLQGTFYKSGKYYTKEEDGSYYLDYRTQKTEDETYYQMVTAPAKVEGTFYIPDYYYIENDGQYSLDMREDYTIGETYYKIKPLYVAADSSNRFNVGQPWNLNVLTVPSSVTLATRDDEHFEFVELKGFGRDLNTLHGLILKMNQMLSFDAPLTRDEDTIQGCLNRFKDLFTQFGELVPNSIVSTDEYGRITTQKKYTIGSYTEQTLLDIIVDLDRRLTALENA